MLKYKNHRKELDLTRNDFEASISTHISHSCNAHFAKVVRRLSFEFLMWDTPLYATSFLAVLRNGIQKSNNFSRLLTVRSTSSKFTILFEATIHWRQRHIISVSLIIYLTHIESVQLTFTDIFIHFQQLI